MKEMIIRIWKKWFGHKAGQVKNTIKKTLRMHTRKGSTYQVLPL